MIKSKKMKAILLTTSLTLGMSALISASAFAYAPGTSAYTTVGGDSLFKIGRVFRTTTEYLMTANNLKTTTLNIGQVLKVPGDTYTVQKGDTMFLIAQKYKMPLSDLQRANNIYSDKLDIGQLLAVPTSGTSESKPTPIQPPVQTPTQPPSPTPAPPSSPEPGTTNSAEYSADDLDLLSRLIMAEAQGEPYQAKVAIGAVVMNRVQSGLFADSVKGVIYQNINGYYQFTPVVNGWINKPANTDSINAAKEALSGADPTNGAIWYYDDSTTNQFMLAKKIAVKIGHMLFAY